MGELCSGSLLWTKFSEIIPQKNKKIFQAEVVAAAPFALGRENVGYTMREYYERIGRQSRTLGRIGSRQAWNLPTSRMNVDAWSLQL